MVTSMTKTRRAYEASVVTTSFLLAVAVRTFFVTRAVTRAAGQSDGAATRLPLRLTWIPQRERHWVPHRVSAADATRSRPPARAT